MSCKYCDFLEKVNNNKTKKYKNPCQKSNPGPLAPQSGELTFSHQVN